MNGFRRFIASSFCPALECDFGRPELIHELAGAEDELAYFGDREGVNRARRLDRIDDEAIAELAATL
jgi:hypothetical protein